MPTLKGDVRHMSPTSVVITLDITGLPDDAHLHVDDSSDGTFAGADPTCSCCGNPIGYVHNDVPSTMEEAYAAAFIPCVEFAADSEQGGVPWGPLYCLPCVLTEDLSASDEDEDGSP